MAFETKDKAKKFGSAFRAKKYDQHHPAEESGEKAAPKLAKMSDDTHEANETPEFEAGEQEGAQEDQQQQQSPQENPTDVVKMHGKAVHVHTSHDHAANKHHVHSVHPDGHVHDSDHASAQDATQTAKELGGGNEQPMEAENGGGMEEPEPDGFRMPRLA